MVGTRLRVTERNSTAFSASSPNISLARPAALGECDDLRAIFKMKLSKWYHLPPQMKPFPLENLDDRERDAVPPDEFAVLAFRAKP